MPLMSKKHLEDLNAFIFILIFLGLIGSLGTAIALGVLEKSFWVAALTILSLIITLIGALQTSTKQDKKSIVIAQSIFLFTGVSTFLLANKIADFQGAWLWTPIWLTIGLMVLSSGISQWNENFRIVSVLFAVVGIALVAISVAGPLTVFSVMNQQLAGGETPTQVAETQPVETAEETAASTDEPTEETPAETAPPTATATEEPPTETPETTAPPDPGDAPSAGFTDFISTASSTPWGIAYLGILFLIGLFIFRKWWGGLLILALAVALPLLWQWSNPRRLQELTRIFSSNPIVFWRSLITGLLVNSRALGWSLFLAGLCLSVIFAAFQLPQEEGWTRFGNILFAAALLGTAAALELAWREAFPAGLFQNNTGAFMASAGWDNLSSWRFYLLLVPALILMTTLKAMQTKTDRGLFAFLQKIPPGIVGAATAFIGMAIPVGLLVFLDGIILGVNLKNLAFLQEKGR
jgi:hypothetical protein